MAIHFTLEKFDQRKQNILEQMQERNRDIRK